MKKYLYHYFNLLISAFQCFLVGCTIYGALYETQSFGDFIPFLIIFLLPDFLIAMFLDPFIRKMDEVWMGIVGFIFSPIKVFGQLFTIIRLHSLSAKGITNFGERGDYHYDFFKMLAYIIFNSDEPFVKIKNGERQIKLSKKEQKRQEVWNEIMGDAERRNAQVLSNKGNLTKPNVMIVPILIFDNKIKYFGGYDGVISSYYYNNGPQQIEQIAKITKLEVNDTNYLGTNFKAKYPIKDLSSITGLYLKPGTYKIRMEYQLKIAPPKFGNNFSPYSLKSSCSMTLNVSSTYENYYIGLILELGFGWTEVTNRYGQKIEDRDSTWKCSRSFRTFTFQELNSILYGMNKNWYQYPLTIEN